MIHTGVDLVRMSRIEESLAKNKTGFLNRVCTSSEKEKLADGKRLKERVSGLFALKEAFAKALGTGIGENLSFLDIQVEHTSRGQPKIHYCGAKFESMAAQWKVSCSLSHDGDLAIAFVIIDGEIKIP